MNIAKRDFSHTVFRSIGALTITGILVLGMQKVSGQQTAESNVARVSQTIKIKLSLSKRINADQVLQLLTRLAYRRSDETWIHFEPVAAAAQQSSVKVSTSRETPYKEIADTLRFFEENGIASISVKANQLNGFATSPQDLVNVSVQVIGRVVAGKLSPGLSDAMNGPELSNLIERGAKVQMMVADEKEVDSNIVRLSPVGDFRLHAFLEVAKLFSEKNPIPDCKMLVDFPWVATVKGAPKIPARLVNGMNGAENSRMQDFGTPLSGSTIGLPGPPHPFAPDTKIGLPDGATQTPTQMVNGSGAAIASTPHSRLKTAAQQADAKSQSAAAWLRGRGQSKADKDRANAALLPLVTEAFQAKQEFHQAELEALSKRVSRLQSLVTEREKSRAVIIRRRVDELLNPDLRWNAAGNGDLKLPVEPKRIAAHPRPVQAVTATRTDHFYVTSDPFTSPVEPHILEDVAKDAEAAYRALTREWFDQDPVAFANRCGIDVTIAAELTDGKGYTTYRFTEDGKINGAMMQVEGKADALASVVNHEVLHLALAAQFKTTLPRWIDEGIAMTEDSDSLFQKQKQAVANAVKTQDLIPLGELFAMTSYPTDVGRIALMHAQSRLIVEWLVGHAGPKTLTDCMRSVEPGKMADQLPDAIVATYGFDSLADLESKWIELFESIEPWKSKGQMPRPTGDQ
jgi:hypothetical protein